MYLYNHHPINANNTKIKLDPSQNKTFVRGIFMDTAELIYDSGIMRLQDSPTMSLDIMLPPNKWYTDIMKDNVVNLFLTATKSSLLISFITYIIFILYTI